MMRIDIITCLPDLLKGPFDHSILQRAQNKGHVSIIVHNLREYATDKHQQVDDYPYGGGAGMVLKVEPVANCIEYLQDQRDYDEIIYPTPDGEPYQQTTANWLSMKSNLLFLCGHYKGVDERIRELFVTKELSIGDYVLSGGELATAVIVDSIVRLIPGVLSDESSALHDSFQDDLLAPPVYTRPREFKGKKVPKVLLSGNDKKVKEWREQKSIERTRNRRPDLWEKND
jgi:tRNA (guanine37-N1)-methyltransferase